MQTRNLYLVQELRNSAKLNLRCKYTLLVLESLLMRPFNANLTCWIKLQNAYKRNKNELQNISWIVTADQETK